MGKSIKWIVLGIVCAIVAFFLYPFIDSDWAETHNAGIWVTIGFFASATITVLCGFNAIESRDRTLNH